MQEGKNIYFVGDAHFGLDAQKNSLEREKLLVEWLCMVEKDAEEIYLMGDLFDIWYEYKHCIPKGFVRLFGKLASMADNGIKIHFMIGNHDLWYRDYFEKEIGMIVSHDPIIKDYNGKRVFIHHGHGLGKKDKRYRFILHGIFLNPFLRFLFDRLHPDFVIWLGHKLSRKKRYLNGFVADDYRGEENEFLGSFILEEIEAKSDIQYYIFGHRHIIYNQEVAEGKRLIITGNWIDLFSYVVFDGKDFEVKRFV